MNLYTIGFTQKNAHDYFELLKTNDIQILLDVRLNNKSQLAGFTKGTDLAYFLSEICHCKYQHCLEFAPTKDILDGYKKGSISWADVTLNEFIEALDRHSHWHAEKCGMVSPGGSPVAREDRQLSGWIASCRSGSPAAREIVSCQGGSPVAREDSQLSG